jgi:hypothetical protein
MRWGRRNLGLYGGGQPPDDQGFYQTGWPLTDPAEQAAEAQQEHFAAEERAAGLDWYDSSTEDLRDQAVNDPWGALAVDRYGAAHPNDVAQTCYQCYGRGCDACGGTGWA